MNAITRFLVSIPVAIILVGIGSAILLPPYQGYIERAKQHVCAQDPNDPVCEELEND